MTLRSDYDLQCFEKWVTLLGFETWYFAFFFLSTFCTSESCMFCFILFPVLTILNKCDPQFHNNIMFILIIHFMVFLTSQEQGRNGVTYRNLTEKRRKEETFQLDILLSWVVTIYILFKMHHQAHSFAPCSESEEQYTMIVVSFVYLFISALLCTHMHLSPVQILNRSPVRLPVYVWFQQETCGFPIMYDRGKKGQHVGREKRPLYPCKHGWVSWEVSLSFIVSGRRIWSCNHVGIAYPQSLTAKDSVTLSV